MTRQGQGGRFYVEHYTPKALDKSSISMLCRVIIKWEDWVRAQQRNTQFRSLGPGFPIILHKQTILQELDLEELHWTWKNCWRKTGACAYQWPSLGLAVQSYPDSLMINFVLEKAKQTRKKISHKMSGVYSKNSLVVSSQGCQRPILSTVVWIRYFIPTKILSEKHVKTSHQFGKEYLINHVTTVYIHTVCCTNNYSMAFFLCDSTSPS